MKISRLFAVAALATLAAAGAHAETYDGVHPPTTVNSRADVNAQAVIAAHSANPYAEGSSGGVAPVMTNPSDPAKAYAEAVTAAHRRNQTTPRESFVNSEMPSQFSAPPATQRAGLNPQPHQ